MSNFKKTAFSLIELSIVILIIGILVAGVTQGSRLVSQFRLTTARTLTLSSPVNSIKDLSLWLETTSENSFDITAQEDDSCIKNWYDINPQTTSKINVSQSNTSKCPVYKSSGINNLPAIYFNNNLQYLSNTTSAKIADYISADQFTAIVAIKLDSDEAKNSLFFLSPYTNYLAGGTERLNIHAPFAGMIYYDFGSNRLQSTATNVVGSTKIITIVKKPASGTFKINGVALSGMDAASMTATLLGSTMASTGYFYIGSYFNTSDTDGEGMKGYFGELIMFKRALKNDEITDIENYLTKKWGVKF